MVRSIIQTKTAKWMQKGMVFCKVWGFSCCVTATQM